MRRILAFLMALSLISGCGLMPDQIDETKNWSASKLYYTAKEALGEGKGKGGGTAVSESGGQHGGRRREKEGEAQGGQEATTTAVMLMDDCAAGTCVSSAQGNSVTDLGVCLDAGTYTFVVASQTTLPTAIVNMGFACLTCAQAEAYELDCPYCGTVGNDSTDWGSLKLQYR